MTLIEDIEKFVDMCRKMSGEVKGRITAYIYGRGRTDIVENEYTDIRELLKMYEKASRQIERSGEGSIDISLTCHIENKALDEYEISRTFPNTKMRVVGVENARAVAYIDGRRIIYVDRADIDLKYSRNTYGKGRNRLEVEHESINIEVRK